MSVDLLETESPRRRGLRRSEYDQLVALGVFGDERLELLRGELVPKGPQGSAHAWTLHHLSRLLTAAVGDRAVLTVQTPICAGDDSEPEPDLAVIPLEEDSPAFHPSRAHLIVEVADRSRAHDLGVKARVYATAGFPVYWVVDLERRRLHVHERPGGDRYEQLTTFPFGLGATVAMPPSPDAQVEVDALFPPA